ncbi:MAG: 50S ribosomal protein L11 methyltransferase [Acidobacteriota bacterium]|nr:50S ribosomal protein L11 methyltransferase [Acidobacteriota bacterium]
MKNQDWFAVEITVEAKAAEAVEFALNELDSAGTEINNLRKSAGAPVCVAGYFNEKPEAGSVREQLSEALRIYNLSPGAVLKIETREVENIDWLSEWKKHWRPTETGKFIVAPTWEKTEKPDKFTIYIEPSMAFGTGTHETTRLCLRAIEENYTSEMSFLDVGTGTGILAIAAAKLKAKAGSRESGENLPALDFRLSTSDSILACDTDEDSIKIARENAEMNGAAEEIEFYVGSISEETPEFDFVCANLTADVIIPLLPLLIEKTKRILVLSGILKEQENLIASELEKFQISDFKIETDGEWISVLTEK